jgi:hypothetical protein
MSKPVPMVTLPAATDTVSAADLRHDTIIVLNRTTSLLRGARDADITFEPEDPLATDPYAEPGHEQSMGWTLGHIIAHLTASLEESAALAAELARGVVYHGRSRNEVLWHEIRTVADCRTRLAESRRMCVAALGMWPEAPDLTNTYLPWEGAPPFGATARYLLGLNHAVAHMPQIVDVLAQARYDRWRRTRRGRLVLWLRRPRRAPAAA